MRAYLLIRERDVYGRASRGAGLLADLSFIHAHHVLDRRAMNGEIAFFPLGSDPGFLVAPLEFCSIFHSDRILRRPFGICQSRFLLVRGLLDMLPALQNSERAKWGSARADTNLKSRVSDQNGISFVGSETLQISTAAPDFSFPARSGCGM